MDYPTNNFGMRYLPGTVDLEIGYFGAGIILNTSGDLSIVNERKVELYYTSDPIKQHYIKSKGTDNQIEIGVNAEVVIIGGGLAVSSGQKLILDGAGGNDYLYLNTYPRLYVAGAEHWSQSTTTMTTLGTYLFLDASVIGTAASLIIKGGATHAAMLEFWGDAGGDVSDRWKFQASSTDGTLSFSNDSAVSGTYVYKGKFHPDGNMTLVGLAGVGTRNVSADANGKLVIA